MSKQTTHRCEWSWRQFVPSRSMFRFVRYRVWNAPTGRLFIIPIFRIWNVKHKPVSSVQWLNIVAVGRFNSIWKFTFNFILDFVNENIAIFMCSKCRWKRINHRNSGTCEITNRTKTPFKLIPSEQVVVETIEKKTLALKCDNAIWLTRCIELIYNIFVFVCVRLMWHLESTMEHWNQRPMRNAVCSICAIPAMCVYRTWTASGWVLFCVLTI